MEGQASTSSGAIDQRRQDALKGYRDVCIYIMSNLRFLLIEQSENAQP
jgi:hypothetical protein